MSLAIILGVCSLIAPVSGSGWRIPLVAVQSQDAPQTTAAPQGQPAPSATTPPTSTPPAAKPPVKKHPAPKKKSTTKVVKKKPVAKKPPDPPADDAPPKRVVRNGSNPEPSVQISPSLPPQQADSQQQKVNALLNTTEENLKSIGGSQLNENQEDMVKQIRMYVEQAKTAETAGDLERANNLATKAQLLSEELVKH